MRNEGRKISVPKRLQTELQATIAFSCYDSDLLLRSGDSAKQSTLCQQMFDMYMPDKRLNKDKDRLSEIELFLEGEGKYKYLFEREKENVDPSSSTSTASTEISQAPKDILILPECLHCIPNKRISVSCGCIDTALLTQKNLTNYVDISPLTLLRHAKDVEANFKKAYALCKRDDSPYRDFKGIYPSGHNRESYLEWIRDEMNGEIGKIILEDKVDEDVVPEESKEETKDESKEETKDGNDDEASNETNKGDAMKSAKTRNMNDNYFKGYIAFSLWGFIPPPGGEKLKSSLISAIENPKRAGNFAGGRLAKREKMEEEKRNKAESEYRGTPKAILENQQQMDKIKAIIINGRQESEKQNLFKCRTNKIEFDMKYCADRVKEIKEEIAELKDDAEDGEDTVEEINALKKELKSLRGKRKSLYEKWTQLNDEEEKRRMVIDVSTENQSNSTTPTKSTITEPDITQGDDVLSTSNDSVNRSKTETRDVTMRES